MVKNYKYLAFNLSENMDYYQIQEISRTVMHVVVFAVLILVLIGILTWTGIIKCSVIPGWCDVYYGVLGEPKILIAYGDDGLGDPVKLQRYMSSPNHIGKRPTLQKIQYISSENLKDYDMVIVERARTMSTQQLQGFLEYADSGGILVWTGDAGTKLTSQDIGEDLYLYEDEYYGSDRNHERIGVWARKTKDNKIVNLENYISVKFKGNYCQDATSCDENTLVGFLNPVDNDHPLVFSLRPSLSFRGDFSVVEIVEGVATKRILNIDVQSPVKIGEEDYGRVSPIIVTSGLGEKSIYYAVPPERFVDLGYPTLMENLYYGLLR